MKSACFLEHYCCFALMVSMSALSTNASVPITEPKLMKQHELTWFRVTHAEKDATKAKADALAAEQSFFTGKPYLPATGSYAFKYRSYQPEIARWTSEDPSGFPDGANANIYAPTPTSEFDWMGLESERITQPFGFQFPYTDYFATGKWEGAFIWTFAHGEESGGTRIETSPGSSGFTGIPLTAEIGGVELGLGAYLNARPINRSNFESEMRDGIQWKRWIVDLEVKFTVDLVVGVPINSRDFGSATKYVAGDWYE
jgi:RHS repeat-associated protein